MGVNCRSLMMLLVSLSFFLPRAGAQPTLQTDSNVTSPVVSADHKVTVKIYAPGAARVRVVGDFIANGANMTKDADGVWSYTTAAIAPGIYGYYFQVDGVRIIDPGNLFITSGASHL